MGKLRYDCYEDFAKRIEFPVVIVEADTGNVVLMNYEAKLLLGQKTQNLSIEIEKIADANRFWTQLHDRKAIVEYHLVLSNGVREYPIVGIVNEFEVDEQRMYMLLFEQRPGTGMNSWLLERIIENSHVIIAHLSFEDQEEIKLNYISKNVKQYGYTCEEFYTGKMQFKDLIHPDDLDSVLGSFAERERDAQDIDCMEYRIVTESRKVCYVRGNVRMVRNATGGIEGMEIVMVDVTGEKLEKDENQYLRAAIEQSKSVVLVKRVLNGKGTVKYVSSNASGIGMDVEDLRKGRKTFTDYVVPEDRERVNEILTNAKNIPIDNYMNKCRIKGEDGNIRWVRFCASVRIIDEYMYDVELLMQDATDESSYEQNLLDNQKALEEKLDYVMSGQAQASEEFFEEFLQKDEIQEFLNAFAENNQLYAVLVDVKGQLLTKPAGPMIHLGEFYDILERPQYRERINETLKKMSSKRKFTVWELEQNNFEKQMGAIPLRVSDKQLAACLICAFDEEAVSRLHNSIESLQKMIELMTKAGFDNQYLAMDSQKSRLAEREMSEELEGQLILARAFANMRNDANATMQEILEKTCELLHLTSIAVYCGNSNQETYSCVAKWNASETDYNVFPEQSWRMAELCRKNPIVSNGGYVIRGEESEDALMEYFAASTNSNAMMIFGLVVNDEIYGGIMFTSQSKRVFLEREIAYCQDVADIIQGIMVRSNNTDHMVALNKDLLNAYNFVSDCVFVKDLQDGKVLFANEAMENLFGMDVTDMDSRAFLSEPTPTYTREGIQPIGDIKWQSYIRQVNKIMNIQELSIKWQNGEDAKMVIMRENKKS
ncbi:MAG: PAS domain-containing protein [Lachnospiraceae bacterium]|nr:PAS domain-containing protein [Lachnospiraceae bacterium]